MALRDGRAVLLKRFGLYLRQCCSTCLQLRVRTYDSTAGASTLTKEKRIRIPALILASAKYTKTGSSARWNLPVFALGIGTLKGIVHRGFGLPSTRRCSVSGRGTSFTKPVSCQAQLGYPAQSRTQGDTHVPHNPRMI